MGTAGSAGDSWYLYMLCYLRVLPDGYESSDGEADGSFPVDVEVLDLLPLAAAPPAAALHLLDLRLQQPQQVVRPPLPHRLLRTLHLLLLRLQLCQVHSIRLQHSVQGC